MLTGADLTLQAEQLADYRARGGDVERWWWSKGFTDEDRAQVEMREES